MVCAIGCASSIQKKLTQTSRVISKTLDFISNRAFIVNNFVTLRLARSVEIIKSLYFIRLFEK